MRIITLCYRPRLNMDLFSRIFQNDISLEKRGEIYLLQSFIFTRVAAEIK